jgi:serine/threonine-protein kinase
MLALPMDDPRLGQTLDGRYRIERQLAAGGMGLVYKGERLGLAKPVAIKFLHRSSAMVPERLERFRLEAAAMSRLTHPNLVSVIDFGEWEGVPYLVMDYHTGASLEEELRTGALDGQRAVFIAHQLLAGLGDAHARGVVHRDLKPGNILLIGGAGADLVKILDFGIAKLLDDGGGPSELSVVAGYVLGTPEYMAPEQAKSQPVDARTDIYAVGVILYEMVTGHRPFSGGADLAVLRRQVEDPATPPRELNPAISEELEAAILRALEKEPGDRWQTAGELATALAGVPEGSGVVPVRGRATRAPGEGADETEIAIPRPRRRWRLLGLLAVLIATAAGTYVAADARLIELPWPAWAPFRPGPAAPDADADRAPAASPAPLPDAAPRPRPRSGADAAAARPDAAVTDAAAASLDAGATPAAVDARP